MPPPNTKPKLNTQENSPLSFSVGDFSERIKDFRQQRQIAFQMDTPKFAQKERPSLFRKT